MEKEGVTFCLLCAELKCFSKLIRLQSKDESLHKTTIKLSRFNISYDDFDDEKIPKMICFTCIEKLDKAFEFVSGVDNAMVMLKEIYKNKLKQSDNSTEDQERNMLGNISDYSIHIKTEDPNSSDSESSSVSLENNCDAFCERSFSDQVIKNCGDSDASSKELTWNDFLWKCKYCETLFATFEELKIHSVQYHQCCNAFHCYYCKKRNLHFQKFIAHVKKHRKYLKPLCFKCNIKFILPSELNDHIKEAHGPKTNYVCLGCNADFVSSEELRDHTQMLYKGKQTRNIPVDLQAMSIDSLTCVVCKKSFRTKELLNNHLLIHTDRKREHTCEKCGKCFFKKCDLADHMVVHNNTRPHQCKICKSSFKTLKHLKEHVGIHNIEKPHTCDQCGQGFRLKRHLNSHSIVHTDTLPHVCSYCDKKFRFKSTLYLHLRQHTGEKPYSCDICIRNFTNWPNYNVHMKRIHKLDMAKKKLTAKGSSSTSKIINQKETNETQKWKNHILKPRAKGRPLSHKQFQINTLDDSKTDKLGTK